MGGRALTQALLLGGSRPAICGSGVGGGRVMVSAVPLSIYLLYSLLPHLLVHYATQMVMNQEPGHCLSLYLE